MTAHNEKNENKEFLHESSLRSFEIDKRQLYRRHLTSTQRIKLFIKNNGLFILLLCLVLALVFPAMTILLGILFATAFFSILTLKKAYNWAYRTPFCEIKEKSKVNLSSNTLSGESGILYLGNDMDRSGKGLWFSREDLVTHMLLLGMTGSGKTETLLGIMYQFLLLGSGFIFCDGKGDITTWFKLYSKARMLGIEDNLLVINFLTAGQSYIGKNNKISNTLNPFAYGSSDALMEIISGFMGSSGNDSSMWRGRAEALGRCILRALCELRDLEKIDLSIDVIRYYMPLSQLEKLSENEDLSDFARASILHYLGELPAWKVYKDARDNDIEEEAIIDAKTKAYEQHGYLTMQFTKTLELLAGTYSHITKTDLGEVDFKDVIVNRRILYIMLPSLEKSPESLKDLGRIIVTNIRNALAGLLGGESLSGEKRFLLDARSTNSPVPFPIILDEYGSYAVEGTGDICAQARSLNIFMCFTGQEFESFKKGSEVEASRINSNTGIKIFMQTSSELTANMAIKIASEGYVYTANHIESDNSGLSSKTQETGQYTLQKINRLSQEDLQIQKPGEGYIFFRNSIWRTKSFYGDFKIIPQVRVNHFIKLRKPNIEKGLSPYLAEIWEQESKEFSHPDNLSQELREFLNQNKEKACES